MREKSPPNGLANSPSAYLKSAAHQPVEWNEWEDAAFEKARKQDKPILLDIGAVWCHWCHVMDRESYENEEIARIINQCYIPIKVDRDERPDIDARYQMAVSALTGQGGWPLTAFLTPQGKPFYGGTYFPPDDRFGRPGMKRVLESIAHNYNAHKNEIFSSADQISGALENAEKMNRPAGGANCEVVDTILAGIEQMFDARNGGFGNAPKFPHPSALDLLLEAHLESGADRPLNMVTATLEHMGRGGVYDQIGGGFHRYSVDERWIVPHFEKMSYDNAGLLGNYLRAFQITGNDFFHEVAQGILTFVATVLSRPEGGFFSSQDADINLEDDGDYFTWTLDEVKESLNEREAEAVAQYYHVELAGEMHHNPAKNVLFIDQPFAAIAARMKLPVKEVAKLLEQAKTKMLAARFARPTPYVDRALYASWNGMMVSAFLEAFQVLGNGPARELALRTLDLFMEHAYDPEKGMAHLLTREAEGEMGNLELENRKSETRGAEASTSSPAGPISTFDFRASNFDLLDDQVFMAAALLDAYEVTGRRAYFDRALELMDLTVRRFWDDEGGGFFDTAKDAGVRQGALTLRRKAIQDSPTPAANSVAVRVLDRLAEIAERPDLREKAGATLDLFAPSARQHGLFAAAYGLALSRHLRPSLEIVVVGPGDDERTIRLLQAAYRAPRAGKHVLSLEPEVVMARDLPAGLAATLPNLSYDHKPLALVCESATCHPPVETPEELGAILGNIPARSGRA